MDLCNLKHGSFCLFFVMFERWTKKISGKVTNAAAEEMKKSFNDRMEQYGDIIQIGLVLGVIIIGGKHLTRKNRNTAPEMSYIPAKLPDGNQPIIINNYYREREDYRYDRYEQRYGGRNCCLRPNGQVQQGRSPQKAHQKYQDRR